MYFFNCRIPPNLCNVVLAAGVRNADEPTWNKVFKKFESETVPSMKRKLMYALTDTRNKELISR